MKWLSVIFFLVPSVALSDAGVSFAPEAAEKTDVLEFRQGPVWPEVFYENSADQTSKTVKDKVMSLHGIEIIVNVRLGSTTIPGAERITVTSEDPNILFEIVTPGEPKPAQTVEAHVKDGDHVVIYVKPPLF